MLKEFNWECQTNQKLLHGEHLIVFMMLIQKNWRPKMNSNRNFNLIFFTVVGFTLLATVGCVCLSCLECLNPTQSQLFEIFSTIVKMGFGAIVGLLSGKALS